jgi:hypothetical protein
MFKKKKFVVSHTSNCGDEYNAKTVDAFDLEDCVANEYLNSMKGLMTLFIVENADGELEFEKEDFIKSIDDVGFKVKNGEGSVWWGDEGGKVIREVKEG